VTKTDLGEWKAVGGHRLWHAPEAIPRTYAPDNVPVRWETAAGRVTLRQAVEAGTGIEKTMTVSLAPTGTRVTVTHGLANRGLWDVELAPWALTVLRGGGTAILPQEPYRSHADALLPVRPMALWAYTDLSDPRFAIGPRYIRVRTDASRTEPQKIGLGNRQGWAAYAIGGTLFVKRFPYREGASYPDYGSNCEVYTQGSFIELETLGPLARLRPGEGTEHVETWELFDAEVAPASTDAALERVLRPLLGR
jgi:hypothetical protein